VVGGREGFADLIAGAQPAAGIDYGYVVPGEAVVRPLAVFARLTTSAVPGDRAGMLEFRSSDGQVYAVAGTDVTVGGASSAGFNYLAGLGESMRPLGDVAMAPMPRLVLWPTFQLAVRIVNGDAGDQLSGVRLMVERWTTESTPAAPATTAAP